MERKEFVKALKLIAIYQNFNSLLNAEDLLVSSKVPLAKFDDADDGYTKGLMMSKVSGAGQRESSKMEDEEQESGLDR